ncbi:portal protein [Limnoglobus roseus]|uniref:Portal protein n=1 Tax=Limnoglobus roseus TaxID=2598579 RepID=A0A5C1ANL2_9BACT|nr:portal protein [Limnoglobus roseus]QEL19332.1 hypothetical protein PX52LOC_06400 [Limnoglobus roseus]
MKPEADDTAAPQEGDGRAASRRKKKDDEKFLAKARKQFSQAIEADNDNHRQYVEDTTFCSTDDQWDDAVKILRGRDRPTITVNKLNGVIKQIIGDYRQNKLSIKVLPAGQEASVETADILAGLIRNIEAQSNADQAYTNGLDCSARGGFGNWRVMTDYCEDDTFDQDLKVVPIFNPLTVHCDPLAKRITREDARYYFITESVPKEQFEADHPGAKTGAFDGMDADDKANWSGEDTIRIAEHFEKEQYEVRLVAFDTGLVVPIESDEQLQNLIDLGNKVVKERKAVRTRIRWRKMTAFEVLDEKTLPIPFIPIIPCLGEEVNIEGKVYLRSAIFYGKDPQRMLNYWKTVATETVALAPKSRAKGTPAHFQGLEDTWSSSNPTNFALYNPDPEAPGGPEMMPPPTMPVGEMGMANGCAQDIRDTTGLQQASFGEHSNETSGRAIMARQKEGDTATALFLDNLRMAIEFTGRILIAWIPHVYDTERIVRTLDLEGNPKTVTVNQRQHDPITGVTRVLNSLGVGKYDVVVSTGPAQASMRQEWLGTMQALIQADPTIMQKAGDLVVKYVDGPGAEELSERLKKFLPPQVTQEQDENGPPQPPQPSPQEIAQAQAMQAQQQQMQAEQQQKQAEFIAEVKQKQAELQAQQQQAADELAQKQAESQAKMAMEMKQMMMDFMTSQRELDFKHKQLQVDAQLELLKLDAADTTDEIEREVAE